MPAILFSRTLRDSIWDQHARLEGLPFFACLRKGSLQRGDYVRWLRFMAVVHAAVESTLERADRPDLSSFRGAVEPRLPHLLDDLAHLAAFTIADCPPAVDEALAIVKTIRERAQASPTSLVGCLYVLEGSTQGGVVLRADAAMAFGLADKGLSYLTSYGPDVPARWNRFRARLDGTEWDNEAKASIVRTAQELMAAIERGIACLHPCDASSLGFFATTLNPEAGSHPVPQDRRERHAAILAAAECWRLFPYFGQRYGERGRRFTVSDGAWLAALPDLGPEAVLSQVKWLGNVLASRGMPRVLLENHLVTLHNELCAAIPEKQEAYNSLTNAANLLAKERIEIGGKDLERRLNGDLLTRVGPDLFIQHSDTGVLIAHPRSPTNGPASKIRCRASWNGWPTKSIFHRLGLRRSRISSSGLVNGAPAFRGRRSRRCRLAKKPLEFCGFILLTSRRGWCWLADFAGSMT